MTMKKVFLFSFGLLVALSSLLVSCDETLGEYNGTSSHNGHEYVDLGLPSGTKWATCNVGATKPWEYGGFYAWGETEEKEGYSLGTYKWCSGSEETMNKYNAVDNKAMLDSVDDVAAVKWGGDWRMPTKEDFDELGRFCTLDWDTLNSVPGCKVIGINGNSLFFPAAGFKYRSSYEEFGLLAAYWLNAIYNDRENQSTAAYCIEFELDELETQPDAYSREAGLPVRPVCK